VIALALRRRRAALVTLAGVVVLCAVGLVAMPSAGLRVRSASEIAVFCMPLLLGLITGTTLFARELDHGEHVFTLTQGARRGAWWASALGVAAIATVVAAGALSIVSSVMGSRLNRAPLYPPWFETSGTVAIAYALFTFAVAATVGLLTRSTLATVVTTMIVYIVVVIVLNGQRGAYLPAEAVTTPLGSFDDGAVPEGARTVSREYVDGAGRPIDYAVIARSCGDEMDSSCLTQAGVSASRVRFQPASRYWPLQLIETGILLGLSALVVAAGRAGLRRATRP
jgi:hypothetical protein